MIVKQKKIVVVVVVEAVVITITATTITTNKEKRINKTRHNPKTQVPRPTTKAVTPHQP